MSEIARSYVSEVGADDGSSEPPSDAALAARLHLPAERAAALNELYVRHGTDLLAMLRARFPGCAEDAAQGAWLKVFTILSEGPREMANFRGWLWTIARNLALDTVRRRRDVGWEATLEPGDGRTAPLDELMHREREQAMRDCLTQLRAAKPDQATVIAAFLDGEPVVEAAERLGITRDNFDKRKQRALHSLQICVEGKLA